MSDRVVREQARAMEQRLARSEANLRAMRLKAWPGAVRTEANFDDFTPDDPDVNAIILSFSIPSGRWVILASATYAPTVPSAEARFTLSVDYVDTATGATVTNAASDLPPAYLYLPAATIIPYSTLNVHGDLVAENAATVQLWSVSPTNTPHTIYLARLRALPV